MFLLGGLVPKNGYTTIQHFCLLLLICKHFTSSLQDIFCQGSETACATGISETKTVIVIIYTVYVTADI